MIEAPTATLDKCTPAGEGTNPILGRKLLERGRSLWSQSYQAKECVMGEMIDKAKGAVNQAIGKGKETAAGAVIGLGIALLGGGGMLSASLLEARLSRRQEVRADVEGVRLTRHADGMVALLVTLAEEQVASQGKPGGWDLSWDGFCAAPLMFGRVTHAFWFDSHPPLIDRIRVFDAAAAERVEKLFKGRI